MSKREPIWNYALPIQYSTSAVMPIGEDDSHANAGLSATPQTHFQRGGYAWANVPYGSARPTGAIRPPAKVRL